MNSAPRMTDEEIAVGKMYKIVTEDGIVIVRVTERKYVDDWKQEFQEKVWLYAGINMRTGKIRAFRVGVVRRETGFAPQPSKNNNKPFSHYRKEPRV